MIPREFTEAGMIERVNAYVENQDFCSKDSPLWPPQSESRVFAGKKGTSCTETCQQHGEHQRVSPLVRCGASMHSIVFRPSATVSRIGLMESPLRHCCGGPPHPPGWLADPLASYTPGWLTPPAWHENVMDGWGTWPLRWLSVLVCGQFCETSEQGEERTQIGMKTGIQEHTENRFWSAFSDVQNDLFLSSGYICEPAHFPGLNNVPALQKYLGNCSSTGSGVNHLYPARHKDHQTCYLQNEQMLFSCAGEDEQFERLCPCRTFIKHQIALCQSCLWQHRMPMASLHWPKGTNGSPCALLALFQMCFF